MTFFVSEDDPWIKNLPEGDDLLSRVQGMANIAAVGEVVRQELPRKKKPRSLRVSVAHATVKKATIKRVIRRR